MSVDKINKAIHKTMQVLTLFMVLAGVISPLLVNTLPVYATESTSNEGNSKEDDSNEDDESDKPNRWEDLNANAFAYNNQNVSQGFLDASKYNPSMHYLVTYNTLKTKYTDVNNDSPYSQVAKGSDGGAFTGIIGGAVEKNLGKNSTSADNYLNQLDNPGSDGPVGDFNDDGIIAPGEGGDTARPGEVSNDELQVIQKQFRSDLVLILTEVLDGNLTLRVDSVSAKKAKFKTLGNKLLPVASGSVSSPKAKLSGDAKKVLEEVLNNVVDEYLRSGGLKEGLDEATMNTIVQRTQTLAMKHYAEQGVIDEGNGDRGFYYRNYLDPGAHDYRRIDDGEYKYNNPDKDRAYIVMRLADESAGDKISLVKEAMSLMVHESYKQFSGSNKKAYNDAVTKAIKDVKGLNSYKKWKGVSDSNAISTAGYMLSTWTPLVPSPAVTEGGDVKRLKKSLEDYDSTDFSGSSYTKNGVERLLETGDIFISQSKPSPVLIGEPAWYQVTSKRAEQSKIYAGAGGSDLSSGSQNTSYYVGVVNTGVDKKWDPYKSSEDIRSVGGYKLSQGQKMLSAASSKIDEWGSRFNMEHTGTDGTLGVDNYGNVISGTTGAIVLPYWQNSLFSSLDGVFSGGTFFTGPIAGTSRTGTHITTILNTAFKDEALKEKKSVNVDAIVGNDADAKALIKEIQQDSGLPSTYDSEAIHKIMNNGVGGYSQEEVLQALSVIITASTMDTVKAFNAEMLAAAEAAQRLFVFYDNKTSGVGDDDQEGFRWTAASLIQKIGYIFDYGIYETIRLTMSRTTASFYNTTIKNTGLTQVFYTDTVVSGGVSSYTMILVASVIAFVLTVYILIMAFRVWRGQALFKNLVRQFFMLSLVVAIPTFIYAPLTEYVLNKPTQLVLGEQMKGTVTLDTYLLLDESKRETHEYYGNMFGRKTDSEEFQLNSYNLRFYTNTDVSGFNIDLVHSEDSSLSFVQKQRLTKYREGGEYPKEHLVYVDVDLLDLYKWVWDVSRGGASAEDIASSGGSWSMDEFDSETMPTLFEWLAQGGGTSHTVTGYEPELGTYDEYKVNLILPLANRYPQVVGLFNEFLGGAGAIFSGLLGIDISLDRFQLQRDDVSYIASGSELFYEIVRNSSDNNVAQNISKLAQFSDMVNYTNVTADSNAYIPNKEEVESVVRDLSLSNEMKEFYYGSYGYSPFSRVVISLNSTGNRYTLDEYLIANGQDSEGRNLVANPQFIEPDEDFLNMRGVINRILPVLRDNSVTSELFRNDTLNGDMYDINYNLIMNYLTTYSVTRASFGKTRSEELLGQAEQMVLATEAFFQFSKVFRIDAFPQTYHVGSITFDKYLSMLYVPLKDYGEATLNFMDYDGVVPRSTAESIVLSSNMLELVLFILAVLSVTVLGLLYVAMFYVVLLVLILYSYIKNFVIKADYDNKAWLGTLVIYASFGLAKLGLTVIWWVLGKAMNSGVASSAESVVGYPHVLLHSLLITAYSVFAIFALSKYVIKPMLQDIDNLGGQAFSAGIGRVVGNLRPSRRGSRGGNTSGSSVRNARSNEGAKGRNRNKSALQPNSLKHLGAKAASLATGYVGGTLDKRAQAAAVGAVSGKLAEATSKGVGALGANSYKKLYNIKDTPVKLLKGTEKNALDRLALASQVHSINKANSTIGGVSEEVLQTAQTGDVLRDLDDSLITTMDMGNASAATVVAASLLSRGIQAKSDGQVVYYDSTGYDLDDIHTRSELFKDGVNELQETYQEGVVEYSTKKTKGVLNYSLGGGTGINRGITLNFGNEGINGFNYDEIFNMPEFKSTFMRPEITSRNLMADGSLSGDIDLQLKDPTIDSTEVSRVLDSAFTKDTELRSKNNLGERKESSYNGKMVLSQISNQELERVEKEARSKGMIVRGRTLYYQKDNRIHQNGVRDLSQRFDTLKEDLSDTYQQTSRNLVNYVAKGGTQGVYTETEDASYATTGTAAIYGAQSYRKGRTQVKIDPTMSEDIIRTRDGLAAVQTYNKTQGHNVFKLQEMKSAIQQSARKTLQKTTESGVVDERAYNSQVEQFLSNSSIRGSKAFTELTNKNKDLHNLYSKNRISEAEFLKSQSSIANSYSQLMQDTGLADEFSLGVTKSTDRQATQDYHAALAKVSEDTGVHKTDLTRFRAKDLTSNSKLVTDKEALTVDKGVASISYKKEDRDLGVGVNGVHGDTEQFILQTTQSKSYVEDDARELIDYYTDVKSRPDVQIHEKSERVRRDDFVDPSYHDKLEQLESQFARTNTTRGSQTAKKGQDITASKSGEINTSGKTQQDLTSNNINSTIAGVGSSQVKAGAGSTVTGAGASQVKAGDKQRKRKGDKISPIKPLPSGTEEHNVVQSQHQLNEQEYTNQSKTDVQKDKDEAMNSTTKQVKANSTKDTPLKSTSTRDTSIKAKSNEAMFNESKSNKAKSNEAMSNESKSNRGKSFKSNEAKSLKSNEAKPIKVKSNEAKSIEAKRQGDGLGKRRVEVKQDLERVQHKQTDNLTEFDDEELIHATVRQINRVKTLKELDALEDALRGQTYQGKLILLIPQIKSALKRKRDMLG